MKTEGSIEHKGLPELLIALAREGGTGILTIQGRDDIIAFAFLEGGVVSADALNQTMEDGLGQVLAEEGLCGADDFAQLASEYQSGGGQVVDLLVERGFVDREQLLAAVRTHTYQLCRRALGWTEGEFKFYRGDEVSFEEGVDPITPEELLIRAGRALGRDLYPGGAPATDEVYARAKGKARAAAAAGGGLDDLDQTAIVAFKLIDGKRSLGEVAEESGVREYRLAYLLTRWQAAGLVESTGRRRPRPEPVAQDVLQSKPEKPAAPKESRLRGWLAAGKRARTDWTLWPCRLLAFVLVVLVLVSGFTSPLRMLLPFPWQRGLQEGLDRERTSAVLSLVRRANGVHYLLHGRYAEGLSDLVEGKLLSSVDPADERGRSLTYSMSDASYSVTSAVEADSERSTLLQESVRGNVLLDPELGLSTESQRPLLVLLE